MFITELGGEIPFGLLAGGIFFVIFFNIGRNIDSPVFQQIKIVIIKAANKY